MGSEDFPPTDQFIASVAQFLIDGGEEDAASVFLSCGIEIRQYKSRHSESYGYKLFFTASREAYDILNGFNSIITDQIINACRAVTPVDAPEYWGMEVRAGLVSLGPNWKQELLEVARGKNINNQGVTDNERRVVKWNNLRFRSATETRIAAALDNVGVWYLPNCKGRLGLDGESRRNIEADFLICDEGRWGILEVDGEPFHPAERKAQEDERDRLFEQHGIRVVQHYDATKCYETPHKVVKEFLFLLERAYGS